MRILIVDRVPVTSERTGRPLDFTRIFTTRTERGFKPVNKNRGIQSAQTDPISDAELFEKLGELLKPVLELLRKIPESKIILTPIGGDELHIDIRLKDLVIDQNELSKMIENITKAEPPTHTFDAFECVRGK